MFSASRFSLSRISRQLLSVISLGIVASSAAAQTSTALNGAPDSGLSFQVYNAKASSFHVNATLISGQQQAVLIDTGFSRADALRIAADVLDSGKTLSTIFISNADPDFYFGTEVLKQYFPQARVLSSAAVRNKIAAKMAGKLAFWGPKMGANAPVKPVLPEAIEGDVLMLENHRIEIRGSSGLLAERPYLWVPSAKAIVGNIAVFNQLHVWTADTQQAAERQAWLQQLNDMLSLQPALVVPGHMAAGSRTDASAILYTRDYLQRFEAELAQAKDAAQLIAVMQKAYPTAGMGLALDIGAKVNKGEMAW